MNGWEVLSLVLGSSVALRFVEHLLTRKSQKVDTDKGGIENIDAAAETWQKVVDKLEARIEKMLDNQKLLRDQNLALEEEVYKLREEVVSLKSQQSKIARYEKRIKQLEEKVSHYEKILADSGIAY